jgi:hypothetical protein
MILAPDLSARIAADHLGHAKISMTQDFYMSRGRVPPKVAELIERTVTGSPEAEPDALDAQLTAH